MKVFPCMPCYLFWLAYIHEKVLQGSLSLIYSDLIECLVVELISNKQSIPETRAIARSRVDAHAEYPT